MTGGEQQIDVPFVCVIGGANIDIHGKSQQPLRSNDSNPGKVRIAAGGVARNIAENLARLGADTRLISAVGDDHHGQVLMRLSRAAGINVQNVVQIPSAATSTYLSVLDDSGDMLVAINDMSIIDELTIDRLRPLQAMLKQSSLMVLDAFLAGLAYTWLEDWGLQESIQFSLAAANITVSHSGTNNPALSLGLVQRAMETQHA